MSMVQQIVPLFFQWPLIQLFPAAWAGSMGLCLVYHSLMSMVQQMAPLYFRWTLTQLFPLGICSVYPFKMSMLLFFASNKSLQGFKFVSLLFKKEKKVLSLNFEKLGT